VLAVWSGRTQSIHEFFSMTGTQVCELNAFVHPVQTQQNLADSYNGTNLQQQD